MKYRTEEIEISNDRQELLSKVYISPYYTHYYPLLAKYRKVFIVFTEDLSEALLDLDEKYNIGYIRNHPYEHGLVLSVGGEPNGSENSKTVEKVMTLCRFFNDMDLDRDSLVVAYGGGVILDTVGFAASIYRRGVDVAYVPTTLLSQVDASIGGKTAVNLDHYKNLIGTFKQPVFTYICPGILKSLPDEEFRSGLAELLKAFIIEDNGNYERAVRLFRDAGDDWRGIVEGKEFRAILTAAVKVKAGIVGRDMYEKGERRKLNLGHTFAHAIEFKAFEDQIHISHGQAVSMGIIQASRLAERLGIASPGLTDKLVDDFRACGLSTECPFPILSLSEVMKKDKKAAGDKIHFVLPKAIGDVIIEDLTVAETVKLLK